MKRILHTNDTIHHLVRRAQQQGALPNQLSDQPADTRSSAILRHPIQASECQQCSRRGIFGGRRARCMVSSWGCVGGIASDSLGMYDRPLRGRSGTYVMTPCETTRTSHLPALCLCRCVAAYRSDKYPFRGPYRLVAR